MSFQAPTGILQANSPIVIGWGNEEAVTSVTQLQFNIVVWKGSNLSKTNLVNFTVDRGNDMDAESLIVDIAPYIKAYLNTGFINYDSTSTETSADGGVVGIDIQYTVVGEWLVGGVTTTSDNNIGSLHTFYLANGYTRYEDGVNYVEDSTFLQTPRTLKMSEESTYMLPVRGGDNYSFRFSVNNKTTFASYTNQNASEAEIIYIPFGKPNLQGLFFDSDDYTASGGGSVIATTTNGSTEYELDKTSAFGKMDYTLSGVSGGTTFTVLAKEGDLDYSVIRLTVGGTNYTFNFDLTLIEVAQTNVGFDASIVDAGDGYRLITIEYTGTTTEISLRSDTAQATGSILYKDPYLDYGLSDAKSAKMEILDDNGNVTESIDISFDDCYYEEAHQLVYMNRYGAWDSVALKGRLIEASNYNRENYKSSIATRTHNSVSYDTKQHTYRTFNQMARKSYTVNTGWLPEDNIEAMYDIGMSPVLYLVKDLPDFDGTAAFKPLNSDYIPVVLTDSSITKQTHKHDKNINYTMNLIEANNYNNRIF